MDQLKTTMSNSPILPEFQEFTLRYQIFRSLEDALSQHDTQKALAIVQWAAAFPEGAAILVQPWEQSQTALTLVLNQEKYPNLPADPALVKALLDLEIPVNPEMAQPAPLLSAIRSGNLPVVQMLLERGAKLDSRNYWPPREPDPFATIMLAIESGSTEVALYLIETFDDPQLIKTAHQPLQAAARYGDMQVLQTLVNLGADINYQGPAPEKYTNYDPTDTALMESAKVDKNPALEWLLSMGADINARNHRGQTALNYAANPFFRELRPKPGSMGYQSYAPANVQRLLEHGVDPAILSSTLYSVQTHFLRPEQSGQIAAIVKLLLGYGADPNYSPEKYTALYMALNTSAIDTTLLLLKAGANVNDWGTKLWTLAYEGDSPTHKELIEFVVEHEIKPSPTELPGLLTEAIEKNDVARVKLLVSNGVDLQDGSYILEAALHGYAEIVQALLEGGTNPNVSDDKGYTPLMLAVRYGNVKHNLYAFPGFTVPQDTAETNDINTVRHLLAAGADPDQGEKNNSTSLHLAARHSTPDIVQLLLDAGALVDARQHNGGTPLHGVLFNGRVPRLVRAGQVGALHTVMHWPELVCHEMARAEAVSAINRDEKIVRMLIAAGADVKTTKNDGWSALRLAAVYSTIGIVQILLDADALDYERSDRIKSTPSEAIFYFGRTNTLFKEQKLNLSNFPWLRQELLEAARNNKEIGESVAHGNIRLQFAVRTDAAILKLLAKAGDRLDP